MPAATDVKSRNYVQIRGQRGTYGLTGSYVKGHWFAVMFAQGKGFLSVGSRH